MMDKVAASAADAVADIDSGSVIGAVPRARVP
jgi:hypothetical protein